MIFSQWKQKAVEWKNRISISKRLKSFGKKEHYEDLFAQLGASVVEGTCALVDRAKSVRISKSTAKIFLISFVAAAMMAVFTGLTVANNKITVYEGDQIYSRYTAYSDLDSILEEQGILIGKNDECIFSGFEDNEGKLIIKRAFKVMVTADGQSRLLVMTDGTVADALEQAGVSCGENDLINAALNQKVQKGSSIVINRVTFKTVQSLEDVPYETIRPQGECPENQRETKVVYGKNGKKLVTCQIRYVDGKKKETTVLSEEIVEQPVTEVFEFRNKVSWGGSILKYDSSDLVLDENGIPVNYKYKVTGKATAYSALGRPTKLVPGCVAMDLSKFPKGTKLYVRTPNGSYIYGYAKVADTGAFVHNGSGTLIDLFFNTYEESVRFGARTVDVYVLE